MTVKETYKSPLHQMAVSTPTDPRERWLQGAVDGALGGAAIWLAEAGAVAALNADVGGLAVLLELRAPLAGWGLGYLVVGALLGLLGLRKLPQFHHPLFNSERFKAFSDDKFFVAIEARDPLYDKRKTKKMLKKLGATHVEEVIDE